MEPLAMLGGALLFGGVIIVLIGALGATSKSKNKFLKTRIGAVAIGAVVVAGGALAGGLGAWTELYNGWTTPSQQAYTYQYQSQTDTGNAYKNAEFIITPAAFSAGNLTLNAAKTIFSLPAIANTTAHTITTLSSATFVQPSMRFTLVPKAWEGSESTNLAIVYFEVTPGQQYIYPNAGSTYKFLTETSGNVNARFNNSGNTVTQYVSGQLSTAVATPLTVYVNMTLNGDSCSRLDNTYDPVTSIITFHNGDNSWSESYTLSFFLSSQVT